MKDLIKELFEGLGLGKKVAEDLETITFIILISVFACVLWLIIRRILRLVFSRISRKTKSKFDDYLIINKIPETLSYFPSLFFLIGFLSPALESFPTLAELGETLLNVLGAFLSIVLVRRLLNAIKDFLKTLKNFKDKNPKIKEIPQTNKNRNIQIYIDIDIYIKSNNMKNKKARR